MTELCVDASLAVKWAIEDEPLRHKALKLLGDCAASGINLIAPELILTEVDSAIRKRVATGLLGPVEAAKAQAILESMPVQCFSTAHLRSRARQIAEALGQRLVYDSVYAALAEARSCEFWTADEEFYKAAASTCPFVRLLGNWP